MTKQSDPDGREWEHKNRIYHNAYTAKRLPVKLVYAEFYESITSAIEAERFIKGWSRAKKLALMKGDWEALVKLAKRRGGQ